MAAVVIVSHWMVLMAGSTCSRVTQDDFNVYTCGSITLDGFNGCIWAVKRWRDLAVVTYTGYHGCTGVHYQQRSASR